MYIVFYLCTIIVVLLSVCFLSIFMFFFFKQKTAYEMRISDWSSDVCSSDLEPRRTLLLLSSRHGHRSGEAAAYCHPAGLGTGRQHAAIEIGRASCRERVCQYV